MTPGRKFDHGVGAGGRASEQSQIDRECTDADIVFSTAKKIAALRVLYLCYVGPDTKFATSITRIPLSACTITHLTSVKFGSHSVFARDNLTAFSNFSRLRTMFCP